MGTVKEFKWKRNTVYTGDCRKLIPLFPEHRVNCIVTSPPYYKKIDYDHPDQIGQEITIGAYLHALVEVFRLCKRILTHDGTLWVNIGDSFIDGELQQIPEQFALMMRQDGWKLRSDIIWARDRSLPNVGKGNRVSMTHEHVYFFTLSDTYFFDPIYEPFTSVDSKTIRMVKALNIPSNIAIYSRIKESVWHIMNAHTENTHFAPFPRELVRNCILMGCPTNICSKCHQPQLRNYTIHKIATRSGIGKRFGKKSGTDKDPNQALHNAHKCKIREIVLRIPNGYTVCKCNAPFKHGLVFDPFGGSGTSGLEVYAQGMDYVLTEINPLYAKDARALLQKNISMRLDDF